MPLRFKILNLFLLVSVLLTPLYAVFAADYTSSSFTLQNPTFAAFGTAHATSTNFQMSGTAGQIGPGEASSTNFINEAGFQYFDTYDPRQGNWRWYDDETNETPSSDLASENAAPVDINNANLIKLRVTIDNLAGPSGEDIKFGLEYSEFADFSEATSTVNEIWNCVGNSLWCYGDGIDSDNDAVTTLVLTDSSATGTHNESGTSTTTFDPPDGHATEFEFTLRQDGARVNTTYYFRVINASTSEPVALANGATYPSLVTAGSALTFTINGVSNGTVTEGITTDITTTATSVPFGELAFDTETEGVQRLSVSTNATEGYQLFVYGRQDMLHTSYGNAIDPVTGTNNSPTTWASGCGGGSDGCYGYHTGDDTLAGGSARFFADNSYAQFENVPREVAYSAIPVQDEDIDIVYKLEVTENQQGGQYAGQVAYIIVTPF